MFWKLDMFLSSSEGRETPTLLGLLELAKLNHWTMGKVHNPSDSEFYTPLSETFRYYLKYEYFYILQYFQTPLNLYL
jgi:hypothetical protein